MKRISTNEKSTPVTLEELIVSSLAQTVTLSKLLIEKGIITQQEFLAEISECAPCGANHTGPHQILVPRR